MKKYIGGILLGGFILAFNFSSLKGQQVDPEAYGYYNDAIKFSRQVGGGTARYQSMGGAGTSLGADMSAANINPAGLGLYRKSEISLSPLFGFAGSNSTYLNNSQRDNQSYFSVGNMGAVFAAPGDEESNTWRGGAFGITFTKTNNFQNQFSYTGVNSKNSMLDYFVERTNGIPDTELDQESPPNNIQSLEALAYWTYLTNSDGSGTNYYHFAQEPSDVFKQEEIINTRGGQYQWDIAYGGNYQDKLYIGGSLGISSIKNISNKSYKETIGQLINNKFTAIPDTLISFTFEDYLKVTGIGVNFKLGFIYKLSDWVRIGTTIQSPTYYSMKEEYRYRIRALFDNFEFVPGLYLNKEDYKTNTGNFNYSYTSPMRISQGISVFAGKSGFVTADIEFVPHNTSKFNSRTDNFVFSADNKTIKNIYKPALNYRLGGELRMDVFRLRGGFAYLSNPYRINDGINRNIMQISGGAGIKLEDYYFDLGIINSATNSFYKPYSLSDGTEPSAEVKLNNTSVIISMGMYF